MRLFHPSVLKVSAVLGLVSCGQMPLSRVASTPVAANAAALTHSAWCTTWGLNCPAEPEPRGRPTPPLSKAQIDSLLTIGRAIGSSQTAVLIDHADLQAKALATAMAALGLESSWTTLLARLDETRFSEFSLSQGSLKVRSEAASTRTGKSGLSVQLAPQVSVALTPELNLAVAGVTLAAPNGQSDRIDTIAINDSKTVDWRGAQTEVTQSPLSFIGREILGLDSSEAEPKKDVAFKDLVPLILPLTEWLDSPHPRSIDLQAEQMAVLRTELPNLVTDADAKERLRPLLAKIQAVQSTNASRSEHLLQITSSGEIHCSIEGKVDFTLGAQFGVGRVTRSDGADDTLVSIQVEGFQVLLPGPFPLPIGISRIELAPNKIYIRDLPIIGSIGIDVGTLPKSGDDQSSTKISCS